MKIGIANFILSAFITISLPSSGQADDICNIGIDFDPTYSAAKMDLSHGKYEDFFSKVSLASGRDLTVGSKDFIEELRGISADGFDYCRPILTRHHSDSFVTEVIAFYHGTFVIYMLTDAINMNGKWIFVRFILSGNFSEVMDMVN